MQAAAAVEGSGWAYSVPLRDGNLSLAGFRYWAGLSCRGDSRAVYLRRGECLWMDEPQLAARLELYVRR